MVNNQFPIGQTLSAVSIVEDKEFGSDELCLEQVKLFFQDTTVSLLPLADSDEIEIIQENITVSYPLDTPSWCKSFLGKKLMTVWVCENDQDYRDQVIFAFEYLRPSLAFVAEGSILKAFRYEQIYREKASNEFRSFSRILRCFTESISVRFISVRATYLKKLSLS